MNGWWHRVAEKLALCCLLFVALPRCEAQINLVPNPSFEELEGNCDSLQCCFNIGSRPLHWYSWMNSPDYFNACIPGLGLDSLVDVPQNGWTFQYAWEGEAYVGGVTYYAGENYREYVGAELLQPLQVGCTYELRFQTAPAYGGNYWLVDGTACNNIGMLFTTGSNAWTEVWPPGPDFAFRNHVQLKAEFPITDTASWTLVEGSFTADSAYAYVVLGNIFPDSITSDLPIGNPDPWTGVSYYVIDGVEVIPLDPGCNGLGVQEVGEGSGPQIRWAGETIEMHWEGRAFSAEVLDALGRLVGGSYSAHEVMAVPKPWSAGMYSLRLRSKEEQRLVKFVVW